MVDYLTRPLHDALSRSFREIFDLAGGDHD
jgi:hypothetical protein